MIYGIPYVGGPLDILLTSSGQAFIAKRIEYLISEFSKQLSQLQETQINKTYFKTEEGFDLIVKAFNSTSRTRQREKIKLYAKIVKGTLITDYYEEDEPEMFLKIVGIIC